MVLSKWMPHSHRGKWNWCTEAFCYLNEAKMLTEVVAGFISKDMRLISVIDGEGFLNLMHVAEPRYSAM